MKLLFLAPQPFFQERGTPIAVRLALEVLAQREPRPEIDLLVYHEGVDIPIPGVTVHRLWIPQFFRAMLSGIRPGISKKKVMCDLFFFLHAIWLCIRAWRRGGYDLIHAVEESVFIALSIRMVTGTPYLYDMDSSLSLQLTDTWRTLRFFRPLFVALERLAVRRSAAVVPVCDALAALADEAGSPHTCILRDISLLDHPEQSIHEPSSPEGPCREAVLSVQSSLRTVAGIDQADTVIVYIGNLERYQGIDLAMRGFSKIADGHPRAHLVIIGGTAEHIAAYSAVAQALPGGNRIYLLGPRPVAQLHRLISEADVLISPRILGNNTPMKVYSFLHSGKPLVATAIASHTQVLTETVARLCEPTPEAFGAGLAWVLDHPDAALQMGGRARALAEERYTFAIFRRSLLELYARFSPERLGDDGVEMVRDGRDCHQG
jgi:glycosyltransferase involved in cell wall biosynthesis